MYNFIRDIEKKQIKTNIPFFRAGDSVEVKTWVAEGNNKKRLQSFEGIVISIRNRGLNSSFTVRKISYSEGIERIFKMHAPNIDCIIVKRRGIVCRAKLYYLRKYTGKAARIKERLN